MPWMKTATKTFSIATDTKMMGFPLAMFALICALFLNFATAEEPSLMYFPDETGTAHLISLQDFELSEQDIEYLKANLSTINFLLYTRYNPTEGYVLKLGDVDNLKKSKWNSANPTRIVTHGWKSSGLSSSCVTIRNAYLTAGHFNVIVIDWKEIAGNILYSQVTASIPSIAVFVSSFINYMQDFGGLNPRNTLIVGHSLGAHMISLAAHNAAGDIAEIVGLDPAGPGFSSDNPETRIDSSHGTYVQVIHTNAGKLGLSDNVGAADFHVNGGKKQPGCGALDILGKCSHSRAYKYFAESILHRLSFRTNPINCTKTLSCPDIYMGGPSLDKSACGYYLIPTASQSPFGLN